MKESHYIDVSEIKNNIDIASVIEASGVDLKRQGKRHVGCCPFHEDRNPSFVVFQNRFYCFGCHEHGDAIDYVMKKYGVDFRESLKHLGVNDLPLPAKSGRDYEQRKLKRELIRQFREWEVDYSTELGMMIRVTHKVLKDLPFENDLRVWLLDQLPIWEHRLDVLSTRDDRMKFELWRGVNGSCQV